MFDLNINYFDLFSLPIEYQVDLKQLKSQYIELQKVVHPDNFVSANDVEQRMSMQRVSLVNQAYETLKSPLQRAIYLLNLSGQEFDADSQISSDPMFLMEQMALRESLAEVESTEDPMQALDLLLDKAHHAFKQNLKLFDEFYRSANWPAARDEINKMMFSSKFLTEVKEKEERLLD